MPVCSAVAINVLSVYIRSDLFYDWLQYRFVSKEFDRKRLPDS